MLQLDMPQRTTFDYMGQGTPMQAVYSPTHSDPVCTQSTLCCDIPL